MLTKQTFYISLLLLGIVVLFILQSKPKTSPTKCNTEFKMAAILQDRREVEVRITTHNCLYNRDVFQIGKDVAYTLADMPLMRKINQVPYYLAETLPYNTQRLISEVWVRQKSNNIGFKQEW